MYSSKGFTTSTRPSLDKSNSPGPGSYSMRTSFGSSTGFKNFKQPAGNHVDAK